MKHVFIIGSKGIPASYGGFETFVEKLTENKKSYEIKYHVACMNLKGYKAKKISSSESDTMEFEYNDAHCFHLDIPNLGVAKAVFYDLVALKYCVDYIQIHKLDNAIVYVLACRVGPLIGKYRKKLNKLGCHLWVNPDGHEWKRAKWNWAIKRYWKLSEKLMVKHAEYLICDSRNIEKYIKQEYIKYNPQTTFIAYGADISRSKMKNEDINLVNWYKEKCVSNKNYYLVVGRFVPENNYETMITEFMKTKTKKNLVIITGFEGDTFYEKLKAETGFDKDKRIKFVGTVYDQKLLKKIRENAYGYLHGHEVGGTNPSLLEALGSTDINLLLDVGFNREVGKDCALYWGKTSGDLSKLIDRVDELNEKQIIELSKKAKARISSEYSWNKIVNDYEESILKGC